MGHVLSKVTGVLLCVTVLSVCLSFGDDIDEQLDRASVFLETGKPDSAAVLLYNLTDSIIDSAQQVRAYYYLSEALGQLGRFDEKKEYLAAASSLDPGVDFACKSRFSYTQTLLKSGYLDECIAQARDFIQLYPDSPLIPDVHFMSGDAYLEKGEYQRAFNIYNDITKNFTDSDASHEAVMKEGLCLYNLEYMAGSIKNFEKYLIDTPQGQNIDMSLYYLGLAYERTRQPELASTTFKRLTLEYPSNRHIMDAYFMLGKNLFEANQFLESENAFLNYIANTDPEDKNRDEALYFLERINFKTGRYSSEIQIAENFISKYPESPRSPLLLFDLAHYYTLAGQVPRAAEYYWVILNNAIYADYADSAAMLLTDAYVGTNQKDKAIAFLHERAESRKKNSSGQSMLMKLGSLYESWGLYDVAIAWYDSSSEINASSSLTVRALCGIGRCLVEVNRWSDAEKTYKRIITEFPRNASLLDVHVALSNLLYQQGRVDEAILAAENALKLAKGTRKAEILAYTAKLYEEVDEKHALQLYSLIFNNDQNQKEQRTEALLKYADLALRLGDRTSAVTAYAKVINDSPDSISVSRARQKLNQITAQPDNPKQ